MAVHGHTAPGFEELRDVFASQFGTGENVGAGVSIYLHGREVAHLWGGTIDEAGTTPWAEDTMCVCYSTSKGLTATCLHVLADRGQVDYEAPVATYWPEFAQAGKERITIRQLLAHQAGMSRVPPGVSADDYVDWDRVVTPLAAMEPAWEPGTGAGYHALTFGFLIGEVVRRVSGKSLGTFLRQEICRPLGLENMYIGAPASVEPRIAPLYNRFGEEAGTEEQRKAFFAAMPLMAASMQPDGGNLAELLNSPAGHQAEIPAVSGVMNARDLARMYGCLANGGEIDGVRLVSPERIGLMSAPQSFAADKVIVIPVRWSLGYMNGAEGWPQGPRETAFGHPGLGGSTGFADPGIGMGFGFVCNALHSGLTGAGRASALADAARAMVAALG